MARNKCTQCAFFGGNGCQRFSTPPAKCREFTLSAMAIRNLEGRLMSAILDASCNNLDAIHSRTRDQHLVYTREVFAVVMREQGAQLKVIAQAIGRNHSTVCAYMRNFKKDCNNKAVKYLYEQAKKAINQ